MLAINSQEDKIFVFTLLVLLFVFNQNLGLMPLLADEPTRALVSLEMILRNNYIFPTLGNDAYLNKPPLFNWILAAAMYLIKNCNEWHLRFISIIPFFITAIIHYIIIAKEVSKKVALWSSIAFLTCGRILFYDSMMAYIDPLFSFVIVLNTYWIFIQSRKKVALKFFIVSYALCLAAFFLKGFPALSFQACTLLAVCIYREKFKSLISLNHLTGIAIFLLVTAMYYYEYSEHADTSTLFLNLISQSSQRTPVSTSISDSLIHLIQFPIQFILDFSPFTFLLFFTFRKNVLHIFKENEFIFLSFLFLFSNIWIYWISAETRARYLFMFLPAFFTIVFYMYETYKTSTSEKIIRIAVLTFYSALAVTIIVLTFSERFSFIDNRLFIATGIITAIGIFIFYNRKYPLPEILTAVILLIFIRITFNFYILPLREKESPESRNKFIGKQLGERVKKKSLTILNKAPINHDILYYMTKERHALVKQDYTQYEKFLHLKNKTALLSIPYDSISAYGIAKTVQDTLIVSDTLFKCVEGRILSNTLLKRESLSEGYYIFSKGDFLGHNLTPIQFFEVTHEGQTLVLAKK
jgi:4-amino-4-deoxy-L-arabinose transferase-like glycosyltransferase